jgi:hypothetical protein
VILDFGDGFFLRQATQADHPALAMICLRTGDAGKTMRPTVKTTRIF